MSKRTVFFDDMEIEKTLAALGSLNRFDEELQGVQSFHEFLQYFAEMVNDVLGHNKMHPTHTPRWLRLTLISESVCERDKLLRDLARFAVDLKCIGCLKEVNVDTIGLTTSHFHICKDCIVTQAGQMLLAGYNAMCKSQEVDTESVEKTELPDIDLRDHSIICVYPRYCGDLGRYEFPIRVQLGDAQVPPSVEFYKEKDVYDSWPAGSADYSITWENGIGWILTLLSFDFGNSDEREIYIWKEDS